MARSVNKPRFNIEITERDIERAKIGDSYKCVVSQAVARAIPDATRIETDTQAIRFTREDKRHIYLTPYAVQGYVIAFDAGEPIEPFSFQLRNPQLVARKIRTEAGKAASSARNKVVRTSRKSLDVTDEKSPGAAGDTANDVRKEAAAAYADAREAHKNATAQKSTGGRAAPARVFKKKQRSYGHRLLRINQDN